MEREEPEAFAEESSVGRRGCFGCIQPRRSLQTVINACGHARTKILAVAWGEPVVVDPITLAWEPPDDIEQQAGVEPQAISEEQAMSVVEEGDASKGTPVMLHVYDALNYATADSSMPVVHLGVEIFGNEFFFGDGGVRFTKPGAYNHKHRHRLLLGYSKLHKRQVYKVIARLKNSWTGERYRLLGCNCQTFAIELCEQLGLGSCIPAQYTYFAKTFLAPVTDLIPTAVCQQLGSQSNSGSGSGVCCLSSSGGKGSDVSAVMEIVDCPTRASATCRRRSSRRSRPT